SPDWRHITIESRRRSRIAAGTNKRVPVPPAVGRRTGQARIADEIRPLGTTDRGVGAGRISTGHLRSQPGTALQQRDAANPPAAGYCVEHGRGGTHELLALAEGQFVDRGGNPPVPPRRTDIAAVVAAIERIGDAAAAVLTRKAAGIAAGVAQVL